MPKIHHEDNQTDALHCSGYSDKGASARSRALDEDNRRAYMAKFNDDDDTLKHILRVARFARSEGYGVLSTGERLSAALALNRADWLASMDYSIAEAINRLDGPWLDRIPAAARILKDEEQ